MNDSLALTEDQRDCLQEGVNVAMGQAGDSLARFLEVFIHLSVPRIRLLMREQLNRVIRAENTGSNIWKEREAQFQRQIEMMEARDEINGSEF